MLSFVIHCLLLTTLVDLCSCFIQPISQTSQKSFKTPLKMAIDPFHINEAINSFDIGHFLMASSDAISAEVSNDSQVVAEALKDGWFDQFVAFFLRSIKAIDQLYRTLGIPNASGWSIVTFTAIVKALVLPLNYYQILSSEKMKQIMPIQKKIGEIYPNDKTTQSIIVARLYDQTKVNPLAGCIPSLAQIPVYIGLYRALLELATENSVNEPFLWIPNLEGPIFDSGRGAQWLFQGWVDFTPQMGWLDTIAYLSIPIFLVISQFVSMKLLAPPLDPKDEKAQQTQQVLKYFPLMIGWFSLQVPSALGVYWMANNILATATTLAVKGYFESNPPQLNIPEDLFDTPTGTAAPPTLEIALMEARVNARPPRIPRRAV